LPAEQRLGHKYWKMTQKGDQKKIERYAQSWQKEIK